MKILILGATGRTGKKIIEEALKKGIGISAIARDPEILKDYKIEIIKGTPYDYKTVEKAIKGCDAVINTLNVSRKTDFPWAPLAAPKDMISKSATNAIKAMEKEGIKRFVALSTLGAGRTWKSMPLLLRLFVVSSNLRHAFHDHGIQEMILEDSLLDYTICRAPMLTNDEGSTAVATAEGEIPASRYLSRKAAAAFFLKIIENNENIREAISIADMTEK